jgi:hypothetical protein
MSSPEAVLTKVTLAPGSRVVVLFPPELVMTTTRCAGTSIRVPSEIVSPRVSACSTVAPRLTVTPVADFTDFPSSKIPCTVCTRICAALGDEEGVLEPHPDRESAAATKKLATGTIRNTFTA